jgi:hypothetical protein
MKATELRIGNLVNYKIVDKLDERKEWFEPCEIDAVDLQVIDSDYQPIPLTKEWFLKFGFIETTSKSGLIRNFTKGNFKLEMSNSGNFYFGKKLTPYVHKLQNLYYELEDNELTLKK